ncbi:1-(5-phosphoribosyl)-5-[(5-phosphoribosylamino)methylideneamino]imidazole-4-carboxamide isomerase [bacterium]|nr:1-(5-phosphoribosyl)-5-[(5-phosphoribosylamino)methylideneamino]imidazole-4-carboxamide isomerase [bacterium]
MDIYPAIDMRHGHCVRLVQGDANRETVYSEDPLAVARAFEHAGARWLHMVDLDGAFEGGHRHLEVVRAICGGTRLRVQFGGGIRSLDAIERCIDAGVSRVVLGTIAHQRPDVLSEAVARFGERIAVGIDARGGIVAIRGWVEETGTAVHAFARRMEESGVRTIVFTDIAVDGMMTGPNVDALQSLLAATKLEVIASGGVATIEDVRRLAGLAPRAPAGCIIGKALYTGSVRLDAAIAIALASAPPQHSQGTTT